MSHTRIDMTALAWSLVREALATRKRGHWRQRLGALVRWRCAQLGFSAASKRLLRREVAGILQRISEAQAPTLGSN